MNPETLLKESLNNSSLAAMGSIAHWLQRFQNSRWHPAVPKMADRVLKGSVFLIHTSLLLGASGMGYK